MSSTLREMQGFLREILSNPRFWGIFLVMLVLFASVGPFGTFERLRFWERLVYWSVAMTGSWIIAITTIAFIVSTLKKWTANPFFPLITGAMLSSVPIAMFIQILTGWFFDLPEEFGFLNQLAYSLPVSVSFALVYFFALHGERQPENPAQSASNSSYENFINRLPPQKRGEIQYLSMQDHYVNVVTSKGAELILMRMADAVAALETIDGLQIHRSHWVARQAIASSKRENGQPIVVMNDGQELPVSRSFSKIARNAGII